ncbi:hypothetical protein [Anatilimnocola floriformis]|uniref:hypothetical protein n=1 Tax=Anatilimnocola floriformis TaxID=2948575 RepID=UPI0020C471A7|nr:hypothetical protein [Anatilimnocola floriformis]
MRTEIDVNELPARFHEALALIKSGQEIVVVANGEQAQLVSVMKRGVPTPDLHPGAIVMGPDFDEPLSEDVWPTQ